MRLIAMVGLVLYGASLAGCTHQHADWGCGGCGDHWSQSYRESTYEFDRDDEARGHHEGTPGNRPGGVVETSRRSVQRDPAPAVTYTCPMHSEVSQPSPGRCPKCGMELVRG